MWAQLLSFSEASENWRGQDGIWGACLAPPHPPRVVPCLWSGVTSVHMQGHLHEKLMVGVSTCGWNQLDWDLPPWETPGRVMWIPQLSCGALILLPASPLLSLWLKPGWSLAYLDFTSRVYGPLTLFWAAFHVQPKLEMTRMVSVQTECDSFCYFETFKKVYIYTHTHTYIYTCTYIYIYILNFQNTHRKVYLPQV